MNIRPRFFDDRYFALGSGDGLSSSHRPLSIESSVGTTLPYLVPFSRSRPDLLVFGSLTVDTELQEASLDHVPVLLTRREFQLLAFFLRNPNRVFGRERIYDHIWHGCDWNGAGRTIDVHVTRLRKKFASIPFPLETVRGVGYRFRSRQAESPGHAHEMPQGEWDRTG